MENLQVTTGFPETVGMKTMSAQSLEVLQCAVSIEREPLILAIKECRRIKKN